jgi:hypothetical protein
LFEGGNDNYPDMEDDKNEVVPKTVELKNDVQTQEVRSLESIEQITRESTPMWLTNTMVDRPCTVILVSYFLLFVFAALTGKFGYMMPVLEGSRGREFSIWKDPLQIDYDKLLLADEFITDTKGDAVVDLQVESTNFIFLLYSNEVDEKQVK